MLSLFRVLLEETRMTIWMRLAPGIRRISADGRVCACPAKPTCVSAEEKSGMCHQWSIDQDMRCRVKMTFAKVNRSIDRSRYQVPGAGIT